MASVPNSGSSLPPPPPVWDARPPDVAVRYAGFWWRVLAALIDSVILAVISQIIALFFPAPTVVVSEDVSFDAFFESVQASMSWGRVVATAVVVWAYFAFQESSSARATVGKRVLGIRVSTADGAQLNLGQATLRSWPIWLPNLAWLLGPELASLVSIAAFVACVAVAFSNRKQGLHDKMAGAVLTRQ